MHIDNVDVVKTALANDELDFAELSAKRGRFLHPNEKYPQDAKPYLEEAPAGAYISVGTERGFIGASLTPSSTHLILVDRDPAVVLFNKINAELIRIADDRKDYKMLRLYGDYPDWVQRVMLTSRSDSLLGKKEIFDWWVENVRSNEKFSDFHSNPWGFWRMPFKGANYMLDDAQFKHIKQMAIAGRITVLQADLGEEQSLLEIEKALQEHNLPVAVFDLSNAWQYIKPAELDSLLRAIDRYDGEQTLLITTKMHRTIWNYHSHSEDEFANRADQRVVVPDVLTSGRAQRAA